MFKWLMNLLGKRKAKPPVERPSDAGIAPSHSATHHQHGSAGGGMIGGG